MIVAIHQPEHLPYAGFFDKISRCDLFILLDDCQFRKHYFQNRNLIKTPKGVKWLTVPHKRSFGQLINEVEIANEQHPHWRGAHLHIIKKHYRKALYFDEYYPLLEAVYSVPWRKLVNLNTTLIYLFASLLQIKTPIAKVPVHPNNYGNHQILGDNRLIAVCKAVGADTYLSGEGGRFYMDIEKFDEAGIKVLWRQYNCPEYPQLYGGFIPNLSIIDLLFNCGSESLEILRKGGKVDSTMLRGSTSS